MTTQEINRRKKDDLPIDRFDYTGITLKSIDEVKKLIGSGEAFCELKTSEKGIKQLTIYNPRTKEQIFYTEAPWQIGQLLEGVEIFNK